MNTKAKSETTNNCNNSHRLTEKHDDAKSNVNRKETCNKLLQVSICLLNWKMQIISYRIAKSKLAQKAIINSTYAFFSECTVKIKN